MAVNYFRGKVDALVWVGEDYSDARFGRDTGLNLVSECYPEYTDFLSNSLLDEFEADEILDSHGVPFYIPLLPVYSLDKEFIGAAYLTPRGLLFLPLNSGYCGFIDEQTYMLSYYKLYADIPKTCRIIVELKEFSIEPGLKPILAFPTYSVDKGDCSVGDILLLNLRNKVSLSINSSATDAISSLRRVLPYVDNVRRIDNKVVILTSDGRNNSNLTALQGLAFMKSAFSQENPGFKNDMWRIDEPSQEYRLICPEFRIKQIEVSNETGIDKLLIFNLPAYDSVQIHTKSTSFRDVTCYNCFGNVELIGRQKAQGKVHARFDGGDLSLVNAKYLAYCDLKVDSCRALNLYNVVSANCEVSAAGPVRFDTVRFDSDFSLADASSLSLFDTTMPRLTSKNVKNVNIGVSKLSGTISHSEFVKLGTDELGHITLDSNYAVMLHGCVIKDSIHCNKVENLFLGSTSATSNQGTIAIDDIDSDEIHICNLELTNGFAYSAFSTDLDYEEVSPLCLDLTSARKKHIKIHYTVYTTEHELADLCGVIDGSGNSLVPTTVFFAGVFRYLDIKTNPDTTFDIVLDVDCVENMHPRLELVVTGKDSQVEHAKDGSVGYYWSKKLISITSSFDEVLKSDCANLRRKGAVLSKICNDNFSRLKAAGMQSLTIFRLEK